MRGSHDQQGQKSGTKQEGSQELSHGVTGAYGGPKKCISTAITLREHGEKSGRKAQRHVKESRAANKNLPVPPLVCLNAEHS